MAVAQRGGRQLGHNRLADAVVDRFDDFVAAAQARPRETQHAQGHDVVGQGPAIPWAARTTTDTGSGRPPTETNPRPVVARPLASDRGGR